MIETAKALNTCCAVFDAAVLKQQIRYDKTSECFIGLVTETEAFDKGN